MFAGAHLLQMLIRMVAGGMFPGFSVALAPVLETLGRAVSDIMEDPQVRKAVADLALDPVYLPGPAFQAQIDQELRTFTDVAGRAGIKLD